MKTKKVLLLFFVTLMVLVLAINCKKEKSEAEDLIKDADGNRYNSVTIGTQVWLKENLKTTRYNNGDYIQTTNPANLSLADEISPKYQWSYGGVEGNVGAFGRLYTGYVVADSNKLCPQGWHVPTDAEWTILTDFLVDNGYGYQDDGDDIAKSLASTTGWVTDSIAGNIGHDQKSNNTTGFKALPGGIRNISGPVTPFNYLNTRTRWWSFPEDFSDSAWVRDLKYNSSVVERKKYDMRNGFSVRCLKD